MNDIIEEMAPAVVYDEESGQILQSELQDLEESPQPTTTPIVLISDNHESFDTSVEDMYPQTLILLFLAMGIVLALILKGVDYERLN